VHQIGIWKVEETYDLKYPQGQQSPTDTVFYWSKIAYARYEYDDQNRLTKYVKLYSPETVTERLISYDSNGKAIHKSERIDAWNFWGGFKDILEY